MFKTSSCRRCIWLLVLAFATSLFARGQYWDLLGCAQIDGSQDHGEIHITRNDRLFRAVELRVGGESIFFDRLVVHFGNGGYQEFKVSDRIAPGGRDYVVDLPGQQALQSVEFWYYKEPWKHDPKVSLYGNRLPAPETDSISQER
jgi:hypothetical protein